MPTRHFAALIVGLLGLVLCLGLRARTGERRAPVETAPAAPAPPAFTPFGLSARPLERRAPVETALDAPAAFTPVAPPVFMPDTRSAWSQEQCEVGCAATSWLFTQAPCLRSAICRPNEERLECAVNTTQQVICDCGQFLMRNGSEPGLVGARGLRMDVGHGMAQVETQRQLRSPMLALWVEQGRVRKLSIDETSTFESAVGQLQNSLDVTCALAHPEAGGVPVEVIGGRYTASAVPRPGVVVDFDLSKVQVAGELDKELIRQVVHRNRQQLHYCYETQLFKKPKLAGRATIDFTVGSEGNVTASRVAASTLMSREMEDCLVARFKTWLFPKPKDRNFVLVTFPLMFRLEPN